MDSRYLDAEQKFYNYRTSEVDGVNIFDINKASNSWSQNFLDDPAYMLKAYNMEMNIEHMSPREYWIRCARDVFKKPVAQLLNQWRTLDYKTLDHLTQVILKYKKRFPITYINYAEHNHPTQEGLHRMIVAGDLFGWDTKFPVMVIKWADEEKAATEKENIRKNKVENEISRAIDKALRYYYNNIDELKDQLYSEIENELKYDDEFENKEFDLVLLEDIADNRIIVTVNNKYECFINYDEILFRESIDDDLDALDDDIDLIESIPLVQVSLTSKGLLDELADKFGSDYYKKPICKEVCEYVASRCNGCELLSFAISVWKLVDYEVEPISVKGHCVIKAGDKIYDYTSGQYDSYGIAPAKTQPRVLNYDDELSKALACEIYRDRDYLIVV